MPGPISDDAPGVQWWHPYVPEHLFEGGADANMCHCGHHRGYHNDLGECKLSTHIMPYTTPRPKWLKICHCGRYRHDGRLSIHPGEPLAVLMRSDCGQDVCHLEPPCDFHGDGEPEDHDDER